MSFDTAPDLVRDAVAQEAGRSCPARASFRRVDPEMMAFIRVLVGKGKFSDWPPDLPFDPPAPPLEPA